MRATFTIQTWTNSWKVDFYETTGQILKWFHRNAPWVTLFRNCLRNYDPSINMVLVNGGYLHCTDKEILVNSSLKATKKKLARVISKIQVSDPGPSWPSCHFKCTLKMLSAICFNLDQYKILSYGDGLIVWIIMALKAIITTTADTILLMHSNHGGGVVVRVSASWAGGLWK